MYNTLEAAMDAAYAQHKAHGCSVHVNAVIKVSTFYPEHGRGEYKVEVSHFVLSDWYGDTTVASAKHGEVTTV